MARVLTPRMLRTTAKRLRAGASALFAARPGVRMLAMPEVYLVDETPLESADEKPAVLMRAAMPAFAASFDDEITD